MNSSDNLDFLKDIEFMYEKYRNSKVAPAAKIDCLHENILEDISNNDIICKDCGVVMDSLIGGEFGYKEKQCHDINDSLIVNRSTCISYNYGKYNSAYKKQSWISYDYDEKRLFTIFKKIEQLFNCVGIYAKKPIDDANNFYKNVASITSKRGEKNKGVICACILSSCSKNNINICPRNFAKKTEISIKTINKGKNDFINIMNSLGHKDVIQYINKDMNVSSKLDLTFREKNKIEKLIKLIVEYELMKNTLHETMAAVSTYIYIKNDKECKINIKYISETYGISENTIISNYKKIQEFEQLLLEEL